MSRRMRFNHKRLVAMRKQPALVVGRANKVKNRANDDFERTASDRDKQSQHHAAESPTPYDVSIRVGSDRIRAYVQTASYAARRHERSTRGSSLLRALKG